MNILEEHIKLLSAQLAILKRMYEPPRKYAGGRNCTKGYNCGGSCITRRKNCRKALPGEAKNYSEYIVQKMSAGIGGVLGDKPVDKPNGGKTADTAESFLNTVSPHVQVVYETRGARFDDPGSASYTDMSYLEDRGNPRMKNGKLTSKGETFEIQYAGLRAKDMGTADGFIKAPNGTLYRIEPGSKSLKRTTPDAVKEWAATKDQEIGKRAERIEKEKREADIAKKERESAAMELFGRPASTFDESSQLAQYMRQKKAGQSAK